MSELGVLEKRITSLRETYQHTEDEQARNALRAEIKGLALALTEAGKQSSNPVERKASETASLLRQLHDSIMDKVEDMIAERMDGAMFFRGVYQDGVEYPAGSLVQAKGTVWVTEKGASGRPGTEGSGWRLLVKTRGANDDAE